MVRFSKAEAADPLAAGKLRDVLLTFCASLPNARIGSIASEDCTLIIER